MKKILFLFAILFVLGGSEKIQAQEYNTSIGLRVGPSYGLTVKHFFTRNFAFEGLLTSRYWGFAGDPSINFTGLAQWHFPIGRNTGFEWFIGGGIHAGYSVYSTATVNTETANPAGYFLMGLDVVGGVQYTFAKIPLTLQFDYKPAVHLFQQTGFVYDEIGFTARYTF